MNSFIKEIQFIIKNFPTKKNQPQMVSLLNSANNLRKNPTILHRLFQKIEKEGIFPNLFCEVNITLIPKPSKDIAKKIKLQTNVFVMNIDTKIAKC